MVAKNLTSHVYHDVNRWALPGTTGRAMIMTAPSYRVRFAETPDDVCAAQRLRYSVFVTELGGDGPLVDHEAARETDIYDDHASHLLLEDLARPADPVVGVYRLMNQTQALAAGGFSSRAEYDLSSLSKGNRQLLELGRSCLHPRYRGGAGMVHLWSALARHVQDSGTDLLFGVASFHGTDPEKLAAPLAYLRAFHLAPPQIRPRAIGPGAVPMPTQAIADRKSALREVPPLIKAYLRLGGVVGEGACVDKAFNTTDVCMILDTAQIPSTQMARYRDGAAN